MFHLEKSLRYWFDKCVIFCLNGKRKYLNFSEYTEFTIFYNFCKQKYQSYKNNQNLKLLSLIFCMRNYVLMKFIL